MNQRKQKVLKISYYDLKKDRIIYSTDPKLMSTVEIGKELVENSKISKHKRTKLLVKEIYKRMDKLWGKSQKSNE